MSVCVACTTPVEISFDEREDFSRYRTWDWLPGAARTIDAPTPYLVGLDRDPPAGRVSESPPPGPDPGTGGPTDFTVSPSRSEPDV